MNFLSGGGAMLLSLVLFPILTQHVGTEIYGVWLVLSSVTQYFVQDLGMSGALIKYSADARALDDNAYLSRVSTTGLAFFTGLGIVSAALYSGFLLLFWTKLNIADHLRPEAAQLAFLTIFLGMFLTTPLQTYNLIMAGAQRYDIQRMFVIIGLASRILLTVIFLMLGMAMTAIAVAEIVAILLPAALSCVYVRRRMPEIQFRRGNLDIALFRSMLPFSLQMFAMSILVLIILQSDSLIISVFLSASLVTYYMAGFRLYQAVRLVVGYLSAPLMPRSAELFKLNRTHELKLTFLRVSRYAVAISAFLSVPMIILSDPFISLWLGPEFHVASRVTQILVISFLANSLHLVAHSMFAGIGKPGRYLLLHLVWAVSNIGLSIVLAREYGLIGVALGTAIPILLLEPIYVGLACREFGSTYKEFVRSVLFGPIVSSIGASAILVTLTLSGYNPASWIELGACVVLYSTAFLGTFWIIGTDRTDRAYVLALIQMVNPRRSIMRDG